MYAIVDIETTGGHAYANGITEIAIVLYDGEKMEGRYHTLINPGIPVPGYITSLTGISNEMLYGEPAFEEVAENIFNLLRGRVFVAHNVNFDYSFIKYHLSQCGYELNEKKLCTVRLSRKLFPGYARYNLGAICRELEIRLDNAHRAFGDAAATTELFIRLLQADNKGHIRQMLKGKNKEQYLPPQVPAEQIEQLPSLPGVYYFHDSQGKIIYVGKAVSLSQRVRSHFSTNDGSKRKQDFLKHICSITYQVCGTELMALVLENIEIRRLWPKYNRSQKRFTYTYGLYSFSDQKGYLRLGIEKKKTVVPSLYTFNTLHEGNNLLKKLVRRYELHTGLCFIDTSGNWKVEEEAAVYNTKVQKAVEALQTELPTFAIVDNALNATESRCCLLIERGQFYGMGYLQEDMPVTDMDTLKASLIQYQDSDYIRSLIFQYAEKYPERKIVFSASTHIPDKKCKD